MYSKAEMAHNQLTSSTSKYSEKYDEKNSRRKEIPREYKKYSVNIFDANEIKVDPTKRVLSEPRNEANCNLLSHSEIINCERLHQALITRIEKRVHDTKAARFRGFVSPKRLFRVILKGKHRKFTDTIVSKGCNRTMNASQLQFTDQECPKSALPLGYNTQLSKN